jgi:hypothetical protein
VRGQIQLDCSSSLTCVSASDTALLRVISLTLRITLMLKNASLRQYTNHDNAEGPQTTVRRAKTFKLSRWDSGAFRISERSLGLSFEV